MKHLVLIPLVFFGMMSFCNGQDIPKMRDEDKIRIREAMSISEQFGKAIWKGIEDVPFVILLVTEQTEFLINHPYPSEDFKLSEEDALLKTKILYRPRQFPDWYLATFPAVNGVNCIVVGTPEKTNKSSSSWVITLLHEHFHQYQFTSENYYEEVNKLNLSAGDDTGMWQLNYPFPYDNKEVAEQFKRYTTALFKVVSKAEKKRAGSDFRSYLRERKKFQELLQPSDYRYFSFQIWQEGMARHTEYKFLKAMDQYVPSKEMTQLKDFTSFKNLKELFYQTELHLLESAKLETEKRVSFYAVGFAEGILLDKQNPKWREEYLTNRFYVERYFDKKGKD